MITLDRASSGRRPLTMGAACAGIAALVWLAWPPADPAHLPAATAGAGAAGAPAAPDPGVLPVPGSGEKVDPARMFDLGLAGDLRVDLETKAALDMIVADLGENPSPQAMADLERSLRGGLPREAAEQVLEMVQSHQAYTQALAKSAALQRPPQNPEEMRQLLEQDAALRRRHFDAATSNALFGVQEAYSRYMLDAQAVDSDPRLSAVEKARQLHALRSALPGEGAELEPALSPKASELDLRIAELREKGGTEVQVQALRTQYLGTDAASSIGEMEAQNAQWAERHQVFRQQRDALLATSPADPQAAVERLMAQHFSAEELAGARAYAQQNR
jgi:lipase chaperone LimK